MNVVVTFFFALAVLYFCIYTRFVLFCFLCDRIEWRFRSHCYIVEWRLSHISSKFRCNTAIISFRLMISSVRVLITHFFCSVYKHTKASECGVRRISSVFTFIIGCVAIMMAPEPHTMQIKQRNNK